MGYIFWGADCGAGSLVSFGSCNPWLHPQATHTCFGHGVGLWFLGKQKASEFESCFFFWVPAILSTFLLSTYCLGAFRIYNHDKWDAFFAKITPKRGARFPNILPIPAKKSFRSHTPSQNPPKQLLVGDFRRWVRRREPESEKLSPPG